ncbi:MAG: hypothetical protein KDH17_16820 [Rhodocyclaceae bacterium]|nr:hypothetical protein [Rhodocyclaceae bacterium]
MNEPRPHHELHDIGDLDPDGLPSNKSLVKASLVALAVAAVLLVTTILPAEYGVDPTGVGNALGLSALHAGDADTSPEAGPQEDALAARSAVLKSDIPFRSDAVEVQLPPHQGAEIKAVMEQGQSYIFHWEADGGPVYFDMHGDPPNARENEFISYWIGESQASASGNFEAPFRGVHGWYWENRGDAPVTIRLKISGFYDSLYMP